MPRRGVPRNPFSNSPLRPSEAPMQDPIAISRPPSASPAPAWSAQGLLRRLVTSNPFYVISADLVFVGLRMSFDTDGRTFETWALMLALAGYTLLLAAT